MVIYKYDSMSDAFHAIQEISVIKDAEISFLSDKFIDPKDMDALDSSALPVESSLAPAAISSGEELMLHYKDRRAKVVPVCVGICLSVVRYTKPLLHRPCMCRDVPKPKLQRSTLVKSSSRVWGYTSSGFIQPCS